MTTEGMGILLGLGLAVAQSFSYVFSRLFVLRRHGSAIRLLVISHVMMGLASAMALPFLWSPDVPPVGQYIVPLIGANVPYLLAQFTLFTMMRRVQASRIAPMLGLKIPVLAFLSTMFLGRVLSSPQLGAVVLCVGAAFMLNVSGGRLPSVALLYLGCTLFGYCISDLYIERLVHALAPLDRFPASLLGACLSYVLCGVAASVALPLVGGRRAFVEWRYALPFSVFWFSGVVLLFACFAHVGPVFGNILQSLRGILSIGIGALLAKHGFDELEETVPAGVLVRRLSAAVLMVLAVWLFAAGS